MLAADLKALAARIDNLIGTAQANRLPLTEALRAIELAGLGNGVATYDQIASGSHPAPPTTLAQVWDPERNGFRLTEVQIVTGPSHGTPPHNGAGHNP